MTIARTLALTALLAGSVGLAHAKDCSSMAGGDDLVPPPKATKAASA